jgi:hypothetical protein
MPYTKKQKRTACAIAHGWKPRKKSIRMTEAAAREMCKAPIKRRKKK